MKRVVVVVGLAAAALGLAACSSSTPGQGFGLSSTTAQPTTTDAGTGGGATTTTGGSNSGTDFGCMSPWWLLSTSEAANLGLELPGTDGTTGSERTCDYNGSSFGLTLGLRTDGGLSALSGVTGLQIGSHQAAVQDQGASGCFVAIGVNANSRAEVVVTANDTTQNCTDAKNVAQLIEPKLPAS